MSLATDLMRDVDALALSSTASLTGSVVNYVIPAAFSIFAVVVIVFSIMMLMGKISTPMSDVLLKGGAFLIILMASSSMYSTWFARPLAGMQSQLTLSMMGGANGTTVLDLIDAKADSILRATILTIPNLPKAYGIFPDIPTAFVLLCSGIIFALGAGILEIVAILNLIFAKLGLAMVTIVGPFFVFAYFVSAVRGWFFSWLNTAMYFVFLSIYTAVYIRICLGLADQFLNRILSAAGVAAASASNPNALAAILQTTPNLWTALLSASFNFLIIATILALLGFELRSIAQSTTGGSGGSPGGHIINTARTLMYMNRGGKAPPPPSK